VGKGEYLYTIQETAKLLQRRVKEITYICKRFKLGKDGYISESEFAFVSELAKGDKEFLMDMIRTFIKEHPFVKMKRINHYIGKGSPYGDWIVTELTHSDSDLCETDDGEIFYLNNATIEILKQRKDWPFELDKYVK